MSKQHLPPGLKAVANPPNPFASTDVEYLDEVMGDDGPERAAPTARLQVIEDATRTILASNDSPDVGFDWSVNPYRGCWHACAYCISGDTPILMGDGTQKEMRAVKVGDVVYGTEKRGVYRRYVQATVLAQWQSVKPAFRVRLSDGTTLVASGDHRFLTTRGWKHVTGSDQGALRRPHLTTSDELQGTGHFGPAPAETDDYRRGYLCGMIRGDEIVAWPDERTEEWSRGFLAGIFDAEGSYSGGDLRISNTDATMLSQTLDAFARFRFDAVLEDRTARGQASQIRLRGGLGEHLRFMHLAAPSITRKRNIAGKALKSTADLRVVAVEPLGFDLLMFDITTTTSDFIADGVVSHNCYARPGHEYLSLGAGTDFDRIIVVKPEAPALLREAFDRPRWKGDFVMFSGVTDCYQPLEASYRVTRGCLEVCAAYRNPCGVITKAPLIERDLDVLEELHRVTDFSVTLSIPFWDPDKARAIEPYVATPKRRMKTVETLAKRGIRVGVNVAPLIPGLGDEDVPAILKAAADAGATRANFVYLRLPGPVATVFQERLRAALPLRAEKVLSRIREARGGQLNDPRFGSRQVGEGPYAEAAMRLFEATAKRLGLATGLASTIGGSARDTFRRPPRKGDQLDLFAR